MLAFGNAAETVETNQKDKEGIYDTVQDCWKEQSGTETFIL